MNKHECSARNEADMKTRYKIGDEVGFAPESVEILSKTTDGKAVIFVSKEFAFQIFFCPFCGQKL